MFILGRVYEYRRAGYGTRDAVVLAVTKTGNVITAAGSIMIIAFAGLIFSSQPALNQISFYVVFSLIVDTLVTRTILVPAVLTLLGEWNYWPSRMPTPKHKLL